MSRGASRELLMKKAQRHRAREAALQILYQCEIGRYDVAQAVETFFGLQWPHADPAPEDLRAFASELAHETLRRLSSIDPLIADTAERWRPERMAVCELLRDPKTPPAVVINKALELARKFSTEEAVKFINGMLDGIRKKITTERDT